MSGVEAAFISGAIASILTIIDTTKKIHDAARNARGLPNAFREVADRLPIITNTLDSVQIEIKANTKSYEGAADILRNCESKATILKDLFSKAMPEAGEKDLKRYWKAVKAYGKGSEVEILMKGMLEDVQLLVNQHVMKATTAEQRASLAEAITKMTEVEPSVGNDEDQDERLSVNNFSTRTQYVAQGEYIAQGQAKQYNSHGGAMHFGPDH